MPSPQGAEPDPETETWSPDVPAWGYSPTWPAPYSGGRHQLPLPYLVKGIED